MNVQDNDETKERILLALVHTEALAQAMLRVKDLYVDELYRWLKEDRITPAEARAHLCERLLWIADPINHPWNE